MRKTIFWMMICLLVYTSSQFHACQNLQDELLEEPNCDLQTLYLIQSLGYETEGIRKIEEGYVVEGDILLSEYFLKTAKEEGSEELQTRQKWFQTYGLLTKSNQSINVYFDQTGLTGNDWTKIVDDALKIWNDVPDCNIQFTKVSSASSADLSIGNMMGPSNEVALVVPPSNGKVSSPIRINGSYKNFSKLTTNDRTALLVHLLGHSIGLAHTSSSTTPDYSDIANDTGNAGEFYIEGTPAQDSRSVMVKNGWLFNGSNLSSGDKQAVQAMYGDKNSFNIKILMSGTNNALVKNSVCMICLAGSFLTNGQ